MKASPDLLREMRRGRRLKEKSGDSEDFEVKGLGENSGFLEKTQRMQMGSLRDEEVFK